RESSGEIEAIGSELADRFGPLPPEAARLLSVMEIKVMARTLKMRQITFDGATFSCQLDPSTPLNPSQIMDLAQKEPGLLRIVPPDRLLIKAEERADDEAVLRSVRNSLSRLLAYVSEPAEK
ncbi:MAG TPA: hypothetical protein PLY45_03605, partial [bacterium]|nr:hypothetical protein [bacterium]